MTVEATWLHAVVLKSQNFKHNQSPLGWWRHVTPTLHKRLTVKGKVILLQARCGPECG